MIRAEWLHKKLPIVVQLVQNELFEKKANVTISKSMQRSTALMMLDLSEISHCDVLTRRSYTTILEDKE